MDYNRLAGDRIAVVILEAVGISGEIKEGIESKAEVPLSNIKSKKI